MGWPDKISVAPAMADAFIWGRDAARPVDTSPVFCEPIAHYISLSQTEPIARHRTPEIHR